MSGKLSLGIIYELSTRPKREEGEKVFSSHLIQNSFQKVLKNEGATLTFLKYFHSTLFIPKIK